MWYKQAKKHTNIMIALYPKKKDAERLEQTDVHEHFDPEPADDLHITLVLFDDSKDMRDKKEGVLQTLKAFSERWSPLRGNAQGLGYFDIPDGDVVYMSFDCPELPEFRNDLVESLHKLGLQELTDHGFSPHLSLGYSSDKQTGGKDLMPFIDFEPGEMSLSRLVLKWADEHAGEWKLSGQ